MKPLWIASYALTALVVHSGAAAAPAGTLLFAQPGTTIVGTTGTTRAATKGDLLQSGERLLTPPGAMSQVLLPDGSLIGMRPDSEVRIDLAPAGSDTKPPVVSLVNGAARVISADLLDAKKLPNFTLQSGNATVKLKAADMESAVVKANDKSPAGANAPGSYQRLVVGSGSVSNADAATALKAGQVNFVGAPNTAPVNLATASPNLFATGRVTPPTAANQGTTPKGGGSSSTPPSVATPRPAVIPPTVRVPLPPVVPPAPVVKPCTRFIGKTCIQ
jgi:hypothetical protein